MLSSCWPYVRTFALGLVLSCACGATPLLAQSQSAPSSVPRPPDAQKQQTPSTVPHPPATPSQQSQPPADDQPNTTFKVSVKLVSVFTTVTDANGSPVSTLKQEDFQVFE